MLFQKNDTVLFIGDSISDYERKRPVGEGLRNAWGTSYVACAGALLGSIYPELALRVINMGVSDSDANKDCTGDGYTNIEKYINGISTKEKVD